MCQPLTASSRCHNTSRDPQALTYGVTGRPLARILASISWPALSLGVRNE